MRRQGGRRGGARLTRVGGFIRLGHPFPTLLNGLATASIATLAGAPPLVAGRLALSMIALQASIGALNDLSDAARDAVAKPGKPIPSGTASPRAAALLWVAGLGAGLLLSAPSGAAVVAVALAGAALGYAYDLRLSRTSWSWLPLALALPLLPIHAWLGAAGRVPPGLVALAPAAILAGAALALANGLVDHERDRRARRAATVVALGPRVAWLLHAALLGGLALLVLTVAPEVAPGTGGGRLPIDTLRVLQGVAPLAGLGACAVGAVALRSASATVRERGWELEAVGVAAVGIGWLAGSAADQA